MYFWGFLCTAFIFIWFPNLTQIRTVSWCNNLLSEYYWRYLLKFYANMKKYDIGKETHFEHINLTTKFATTEDIRMNFAPKWRTSSRKVTQIRMNSWWRSVKIFNKVLSQKEEDTHSSFSSCIFKNDLNISFVNKRKYHFLPKISTHHRWPFRKLTPIFISIFIQFLTQFQCDKNSNTRKITTLIDYTETNISKTWMKHANHGVSHLKTTQYLQFFTRNKKQKSPTYFLGSNGKWFPNNQSFLSVNHFSIGRRNKNRWTRTPHCRSAQSELARLFVFHGTHVANGNGGKKFHLLLQKSISQTEIYNYSYYSDTRTDQLLIFREVHGSRTYVLFTVS